MSRLYLLRHARAAWPKPGMTDFDRPLEEPGRDEAIRLGREMNTRGFRPDRVVCSTARRARETWSLACEGLQIEESAASFSDDLYHSDAGTYSEVITESSGDGSLMIIGHNPMMEDIALALSVQGESDARKTLRAGFSVCGLAIIDFEGPINRARPDAGYLRLFLRPSELTG